jgi:hypothetical protein
MGYQAKKNKHCSEVDMRQNVDFYKEQIYKRAEDMQYGMEKEALDWSSVKNAWERIKEAPLRTSLATADHYDNVTKKIDKGIESGIRPIGTGVRSVSGYVDKSGLKGVAPKIDRAGKAIQNIKVKGLSKSLGKAAYSVFKVLKGIG